MRRIELTRDEPTTVDPDPEAETRILEGLNEKQRAAVTTTDGPVMIIAGPGSGKTRALTHRIAYLLAAGKAQPRDILALTFTNKAAGEMKERVERLVGDDARGMWVGTFHSSFARLLRMEGDKIGYTQDFSIYDTADSKRIIKQQMQSRRLSGLDTDVVSPRSAQRMISDAKNEMIGPEEYASLARGDQQEMVAEVYPAYERALKQANALDFDDLLLKPIELFEEHDDVLEKYQTRWQYVHIDEYQDTNKAQYVLARKLADRHKNLCVVGDDAQSIYAFRGADITNILNFENDYPDATTIRLERNYRSTKNIIRLADSIIEENDDQIEKSLWTDNAEGEYVALMEALSEKDEAQKIERRIRDLHLREGLEHGDFAVLYRTNAQSRALEEALRTENVPYRVIGGTSFYERKEIKDVLAYLKLMVNPNDTASLQRVINYPTRGIGDKTQERLQRYAHEHGLSLWQAVERVEQIDTLGTRAERAVGTFRDLIARYLSKVDSEPADDLARDLVQDAGLLSELRKEHTRENLRRWENVQELISALAEYVASTDDASISTFLQEVALMTDQDEAEDEGDKVTLMTLHAAKGTEYPVVFIAGLEEGLFPLEQATQEKADLEEERRLFYVGVTRAETRLYLSWARSRYRYGEQQSNTRSRFLEEVDSDVVRTEAGGELEQAPNRFSAGDGPDGGRDYDEMDPHYYRQDLSGNGKTGASSEDFRRIESTDGGSGRRSRQLSGEEQGEIVPGARVEHAKFGEGKVQSVEGEGEKATAVVFFGGDVGNKKLKLKFAKLRVIG